MTKSEKNVMNVRDNIFLKNYVETYSKCLIIILVSVFYRKKLRSLYATTISESEEEIK